MPGDFDGHRLREIRQELELTLEQLSGRIRDIAVENGENKDKARKKYGPSWLGRVERRENQPGYGAAARIAEATGQDMDYFAYRRE